jgi:methylmalonyl-CoA/ethylmalonyl-CoA epimerase
MHLDHIGIAVKNIEEAVKTYESLLGKSCYKKEIVDGESVETTFFEAGESKLELLAATTADSVITSFIERRGEGIHHIAFRVENLEAEIGRLKKEGFRLINETPKMGADNKRIVFLHPKSSHGVLVELCESVKP